MVQVRTTDERVLILTGLSKRGFTEWVFMSKGWDIDSILRQFRFSGTAQSRTRQCLATPSSVKQLAALYGEASMAPSAQDVRLTDLLDRALIAINLTVTAPHLATPDEPKSPQP